MKQNNNRVLPSMWELRNWTNETNLPLHEKYPSSRLPYPHEWNFCFCFAASTLPKNNIIETPFCKDYPLNGCIPFPSLVGPTTTLAQISMCLCMFVRTSLLLCVAMLFHRFHYEFLVEKMCSNNFLQYPKLHANGVRAQAGWWWMAAAAFMRGLFHRSNSIQVKVVALMLCCCCCCLCFLVQPRPFDRILVHSFSLTFQLCTACCSFIGSVLRAGTPYTYLSESQLFSI